MQNNKTQNDSVLFKNLLKLIDSKFRKRQALLVSEFARYFCANITSGDIEFKDANATQRD